MIIKDILLSSTQVLKGDIREAICTHALYYAIWKKYEAMPERFNWQSKQSEVHFSPLRPELIESTYLLHQVRCLINRRSRRRGGLMVSALDFGWRGLGPSTGRVIELWEIWPKCIPDQFVFLSQATHHPFYLHVGREIMRDIEKHSKARFVCVMLLVFVCSFVWFRHDQLSVDQFSAEIGKF